MIKLIGIKTSSAIWEIDGIVIKTQRLKNVGNEKIEKNISDYINLMTSGNYKRNPNELYKIAETLGSTMILKIGTDIYLNYFLKMFDYYTKEYIKQWAEIGGVIISNKISMFPVFEYMFQGKIVEKEDSNIAILRSSTSDNAMFFKVFDKRFSEFWTAEIKSTVKNQNLLVEIEKRIGCLRVTKYICRLPKEEVKKYLENIAKDFTKTRCTITVQKYYHKLLGNNISVSRKRFDPIIVALIDEIVNEEYKIQCSKFILDNAVEMDVRKDRWKLYCKQGPSLFLNVTSFTNIKSASLKLEVKYYMKFRYETISMSGHGVFNPLSNALNILVENNSLIHYCADIDEVDVRSLYMSMERKYNQNSNGKSVSEIMRVFSVLSLLTEYLRGDRRDVRLITPVPHENPFKRFKFHNVKDYKVRTSIMPECVVDQLDVHISELDETQTLLYRIFSHTGMRLKEVLFLEVDCLEPSRYEGLVELKYKPYKSLKARRKRGISDYHKILIFQSLADGIEAEIRNRAHWRIEFDVPYIFINKRENCRASMLNMAYYVRLINKLIKRNNICDEVGELWHFTSKQQRKTLAVKLIENGGTVDELAYWLGHLSTSTASGYYSEVRKMKLAELNTTFFKEKFDVLLSNEQITKYTEEERRLLYMDFRLEQRRVEFGFCLKKLADGGCTNRSSLYNCVNCKNLCTGRKYLTYWEKLLSEQSGVVDGLINTYASVDVGDYIEFKEYKQAVFLQDCYKNMVIAIKAGEK